MAKRRTPREHRDRLILGNEAYERKQMEAYNEDPESETAHAEKKFLLWTGVILFMSVILVGWSLSLRNTLQGAGAQDRPQTASSFGWQDFQSDVSSMISESKEQVSQLFSLQDAQEKQEEFVELFESKVQEKEEAKKQDVSQWIEYVSQEWSVRFMYPHNWFLVNQASDLTVQTSSKPIRFSEAVSVDSDAIEENAQGAVSGSLIRVSRHENPDHLSVEQWLMIDTAFPDLQLSLRTVGGVAGFTAVAQDPDATSLCQRYALAAYFSFIYIFSYCSTDDSLFQENLPLWEAWLENVFFLKQDIRLETQE